MVAPSRPGEASSLFLVLRLKLGRGGRTISDGGGIPVLGRLLSRGDRLSSLGSRNILWRLGGGGSGGSHGRHNLIDLLGRFLGLLRGGLSKGLGLIGSGGGRGDAGAVLGHLNVVFLLGIFDRLSGGGGFFGSAATSAEQPLGRLERGRRAAWLGDEHLAGLVDGKDATLGPLWSLGEADGGDELAGWIAEERVGQALLLLEGGVGFGRVGAEAVDGVAGGLEGFIRVPEEACLPGAWRKGRGEVLVAAH